MKDKTLYWILGIIAAYFLVRFIMNRTSSVVKFTKTKKTGWQKFVGHKVRFNINPNMAARLIDGTAGYGLSNDKPIAYGSEQPAIHDGDVYKVVKIIETPNQRICWNDGCSDPFTRLEIYLENNYHFTTSDIDPDLTMTIVA